MKLDKLSMQFAMHETKNSDQVLEAYERLIHDAMRGDHTLFTTAAGIERLWELSEPLLADPPPVRSYGEGTWGPNAIHQLIAPRAWRLPFERAWRDPNESRGLSLRPGHGEQDGAMDYTHLGRSGLSVSRLCLGTMNFGPETSEEDSPRDHGPGARARHQLLRHRQRLRLGAGRGRHRADHRALVRPGWRPAREDRDRHQALRLDERLAQRHLPVGAQHPARVRRVAEAAADRLHRPLPDAPRRPEHAVGRDLGGVRGAAPAGQGALRRLLQLRRLAHRAGAWRPPGAGSRPGWSASSRSTTCSSATSSSRCCPACQDYGLGVIPWSPLNGGLLGGIIRKTEKGQRRLTGRAKDALKTHRKALEAYEDFCDELGEQPAHVGLAWLLHQDGRHRRRSSARGRWSSSTAPCGRLEIRLDEGRAGPARRDLPRTGRAGPRGLRLVKPRTSVLPPTASRRRWAPVGARSSVTTPAVRLPKPTKESLSAEVSR